jgi:hypothetical protein
MQNNTLSKHTYSFGLSLAICSLINAILVIAKEKSHAVQAEMQKLTGSHWITHAAIVLILFFALGLLLPAPKGGQDSTIPVNRLIKIIVGGVVAAGVVIVGFYLIAD